MLLFLNLIKTETVTGFQNYENEQYLNVSYEDGYKSIKESMLYEKKTTDDDYVYIKSLKKYTRWCLSKEEYKKSLEENSEDENVLDENEDPNIDRDLNIDKDSNINEEEEEDTKENNKKNKKRVEKIYKEIFVDLRKVKKEPDTVYYIEIKVIGKKNKEDSINTRSFAYSKKQDRWIFTDKPNFEKKSWWNSYVVIGIVGVLALGVFIYLLV